MITKRVKYLNDTAKTPRRRNTINIAVVSGPLDSYDIGGGGGGGRGVDVPGSIIESVALPPMMVGIKPGETKDAHIALTLSFPGP